MMVQGLPVLVAERPLLPPEALPHPEPLEAVASALQQVRRMHGLP
jgi:hypothetical protein